MAKEVFGRNPEEYEVTGQIDPSNFPHPLAEERYQEILQALFTDSELQAVNMSDEEWAHFTEDIDSPTPLIFGEEELEAILVDMGTETNSELGDEVATSVGERKVRFLEYGAYQYIRYDELEIRKIVGTVLQGVEPGPLGPRVRWQWSESGIQETQSVPIVVDSMVDEDATGLEGYAQTSNAIKAAYRIALLLAPDVVEAVSSAEGRGTVINDEKNSRVYVRAAEAAST